MFKMCGLNYSWLRAFSLRVFSKSKLIWIWIIFSWGILEISDDYCELHWMIKDRAPAIRAALQQSSPLAREKDPVGKLTLAKNDFSIFQLSYMLRFCIKPLCLMLNYHRMVSSVSFRLFNFFLSFIFFTQKKTTYFSRLIFWFSYMVRFCTIPLCLLLN